jgi:hypothetical protein
MSVAVPNRPCDKAPAHHEGAPGEWLPRALGESPEEFESHAIASEDRFRPERMPLWDWEYLTVPQRELWTDIWEEWPANMEAD